MNSYLVKLRFIALGIVAGLILISANPAYSFTGSNNLEEKILPITGVVKNEQGEFLAGATIKIKGTEKIVTSDENGSFQIDAEIGQTLEISFTGYSKKEVIIESESSLNIVLRLGDSGLDEVVVVGYGVERKRNIIGAVSVLSGEVLEDRSNPNLVRSIQGAIPGVTLEFRDGKPSRGHVPNIRGAATSIGSGGSALVLIDGVEGDMATVNPNDVENISVLKDASSAAVYGARGAFGVILITTKQPKRGSARINYNNNLSVNQRTVKWEDNIITDPITWTDAWYEFYQGAYDYATVPNGINNIPYSQDWYNELQRVANDPDLYKYRVVNGRYQYFENTNWLDLFYKDQNFSQSHNLSIQGANENASYFLSGRYFSQESIYKIGDEQYDQFNLRANGSVKIKPWITLSNNTSVYTRKFKQPMLHYNNQLVQRQIEHEGQPIAPVRNPDGSWTRSAVLTGYAAFSEGTSWQNNDKLDVINSTTIDVDVIKNVLKLNGAFNYKAIRSQRQRLENMYDFKLGPDIEAAHNTFSSYQLVDYVTNYLSANITTTYTPVINEDHDLKILGGWNIEDEKYQTHQMYRRGILYPNLPSFTLMDGDYYTTTSGGYSWGFVGLFYRVNYAFRNKYLVELSGRYDGSSKFPTDKQFGFFPSASLGWVLTQESFLLNSNAVSYLKLRGSAGTLGNGQIDPYSFLETMSIGKTSVILDGNNQSYTGAPSLIPANLTWEKVTTYNIGVDAEFFNNKLSFTGDYYVRTTTDMFTVGPNLPQVLGANAPFGNNADLETKGWELSVGWSDSRMVMGKPFNFRIKGMLWDSRTYITKYFNEDGDITTYYEGMEIGDIWGFRVAGLFASDEEAAYWHDQKFFNNSAGRISLAGDLKFHDLNHDGIINRGNQTLDNHGDLEVIGNSSPRFSYGLNLSGDWNNFSLSIFLQGVGKKDWYPYPESDFFWGMYGRPYGYLIKNHVGSNVWTEDNPNPNAYWPRQRGYAANRTVGPMSLPNDRYLQDVSYLRVKNITLGYSLPKSITDRTAFQSIRFHLTAENLFTFSNLFKYTDNFDPEVIRAGDTDFRSTRGVNNDGEGYSYPMLKTISFGINITL